MRKITTYTVKNNVLYIIKSIWTFDRILFFAMCLRIPILIMLSFGMSYLPKLVIESLTSNLQVQDMVVKVGVFVLFMVLVSIIEKWTLGNVTWRASNIRFKFADKVFSKLMDGDYEIMEKESTRVLLKKAEYATYPRRGIDGIINNTVQLTTDFIGFMVFSIIIIITINPIIVLLIISMNFLTYYLIRRARNYEYSKQNDIAKIDRKIRYLVNKSKEYEAGKDIRLYKIYEWFKVSMQNYITSRINIAKKIKAKWYLSNVVDGMLTLVRDGIVFIVLIRMVLNNEMEIADFILYIGLIKSLSSWISGILNNLSKLNKNSMDICVLRTFLNLKDCLKRDDGISTQDYNVTNTYEVEFCNVIFRYPGTKKDTIKNMNLKINKGEKLAVVGINGAGKSTLVKLLSGLYHTTSGEILVNGIPINDYNRDEYYLLIGAVFQEIKFMPISLAGNVAMVSEEQIDRKKVMNCIIKAGLKKKIELLPKGIDSMMLKEINDNAEDFSGGEKQKIILARALYKNAPILILDEPTAAMDPISENELYEKYCELTEGKTSIFISHRLSSTKFCDRIVLLEDGQIKEIGTHEELMEQKSKYANMFEIQSHYYKHDNMEVKSDDK